MAAKVQRQLQAVKKIYPWISTPLIVSAPMRVFAGPALATAVFRAGGIGFMGPGTKPSELENALMEVRRLLHLASPSSHNTSSLASKNSDDYLPIGIGFQTFDADLSVAVEAIQRHRPAAVWLFASREGQAEFDVWIQNIRKVSSKTQIWIQVGSVADALKAVHAVSPPDVLVLQGIDAGGHGLARGAGIISLLPEVADAIKESNIPLVAAGGIADGRGVAAALSMGAIGAAMGTRFLASTEAKISKGYRQDVLRTTDGGQTTVRTTLYDELAARADWPPMYDGRNIINKSIIDHESGLDMADNKKLYAKALTLGDDGWGLNGRLTEYVGSAVGLVREVAPAEDIVNGARSEAIAALGLAQGLL